MRQLCESGEYDRKTALQVQDVQVHTAMLKRIPDPTGYPYGSARDASSPTGLQQLITSIRTGAGYATMF